MSKRCPLRKFFCPGPIVFDDLCPLELDECTYIMRVTKTETESSLIADALLRENMADK